MKFSYNGKARNDMVQSRNSINSRTFLYFRWHVYLQPECNFLHGYFRCKLPVGSSGHGGQSHVHAGDTHFQERPNNTTG